MAFLVVSSTFGNVIAMCDVAHQCRVVMDTAQDNAISVHCPDGSVLRFGQMSNGL
jgi:hypothetical protein